MTTMFYSNVRSVVNKVNELNLLMFDLNPDLICLCETWTNENITDSFLNLENYNLISRRDRTDTANRPTHLFQK